MYEIIENKKKGKALSKEEIGFVIKGYTKGEIPDYQMSALLMAIYFKGMTIEETSELTLAMANSGNMVDLSAIRGKKVDKHSTGGVGDKTTIVLAPLVAAAGVKVAKMSGRGLGHTGGTIDKLESIPGFKTELPEQEFIDNVNSANIAVVSQSGNLAPADKKIYALRDVTATVDHISLIASSVMSKKIASGADAIVLDVKYGSGAFMKTVEDAKELAKTMVHIGKQVGRKTTALVTDMTQPLGKAVGNALEVIEAIETLKGKGPKDLIDLTVVIASHMLVLAEICTELADAERCIRQIIKDGSGIAKFKEWIVLQGGDPSVVEDYSLLPTAEKTLEVKINKTGYVSGINAELIGQAALMLGAGRETKESQLDLSAGLILQKKIGDYIDPNTSVVTLYYNKDKKLDEAIKIIEKAYEIQETSVKDHTFKYELIHA